VVARAHAQTSPDLQRHGNPSLARHLHQSLRGPFLLPYFATILARLQIHPCRRADIPRRRAPTFDFGVPIFGVLLFGLGGFLLHSFFRPRRNDPHLPRVGDRLPQMFAVMSQAAPPVPARVVRLSVDVCMDYCPPKYLEVNTSDAGRCSAKYVTSCRPGKRWNS
jgi:hypothetical protein